MSYSAPTPSAPGTPLAEQTAGEIVAASPNLSNTYRALFAGLADFETDTVRHIHLENDVLFPRALNRLNS